MIREVPLTADDQAIFERMSQRAEAQLRYADRFAVVKTASFLRAQMSIVEGVSLLELAGRACESGRWP